ncbi:MAG: hypothetical protein LBF49_02465 [Puniceicoccales bacterium]|jgi:hypothetical protein|nr:hypothetical protein [Puniceicoccales bacterium]
MADSSEKFPLLALAEEGGSSASFLKMARALAKEENISLPKYLMGMIWHSVHGHNLSKIHFYQDGSGDTYDIEFIGEVFRQMEADDAAGKLKTFNSAEEGLAYLAEIRKVVSAGKEVD